MLLQLLSTNRAISKTLSFTVIESSLAGRRFQVSQESIDFYGVNGGPIAWQFGGGGTVATATFDDILVILLKPEKFFRRVATV